MKIKTNKQQTNKHSLLHIEVDGVLLHYYIQKAVSQLIFPTISKRSLFNKEKEK
jgi:hypothetical protein